MVEALHEQSGEAIGKEDKIRNLGVMWDNIAIFHSIFVFYNIATDTKVDFYIILYSHLRGCIMD